MVVPLPALKSPDSGAFTSCPNKRSRLSFQEEGSHFPQNPFGCPSHFLSSVISSPPPPLSPVWGIDVLTDGLRTSGPRNREGGGSAGGGRVRRVDPEGKKPEKRKRQRLPETKCFYLRKKERRLIPGIWGGGEVVGGWRGCLSGPTPGGDYRE